MLTNFGEPKTALEVRATELRKGDRFVYEGFAVKVLDSIQNLDNNTVVCKTKLLGMLWGGREMLAFPHKKKFVVIR